MKKILLFFSLVLFFTQCSEDNLNDNIDISSSKLESKNSLSLEERNAYLKKFSEILSKSIYDNTNLRKFLKEEALKKFDNDYDVLYQIIKNKTINGVTFRDILISNSSENEINNIENNIPLLNILIPNIEMFNINANNLDINDNDIPVIFAKEDENIYYFNGKKEITTSKEEIPNFHSFIINENNTIEKIIIANSTNKLQSKSNNFEEPIIKFISPIYDNRYPTATKILSKQNFNRISNLVRDSYKYFYSDKGDKYQKAFQRDYIYYGMTPDSKEGYLNNSINEEINFLSINPNTYFSFSKHPDNPKIKENQFTVKRRPVSTEEQIRRMWSEGEYRFRLYNITSNSSEPEIKDFSLKPEQIWNFNIEYNKNRNGTVFRRSKHTYKIDPSKFTPKIIDFNEINNSIVLNKWNWDISKESLFRKLKLIQYNNDIPYTDTKTYETTFVKESKFNSGKAKLKLGPIEFGELPSANINSTNTRKESRTITITGTHSSIELGETQVYFYDPVIINSNYDLHRYGLGSVQFSMIPK